MTETTTPSVEGDRLEAIARIIDPGARKSFERNRQNIIATYRPEHQHEHFEEIASLIEPSLAKARQIAALPCKGGEAEPVRWGRYNASTNRWDRETWASEEMAQRACDNPHVQKLGEGFRPRPLYATPTTEPDTGRGLREALEETVTDAVQRVAKRTFLEGYSVTIMREGIATLLAALSDTPRGKEEGKQGLMASRDLGPTTVASSLKGSDVGEDEDPAEVALECGYDYDDQQVKS